MLDALDETLKATLREIGGLNADEIDIVFEAPDREWSGRVGKPTVNCYLYDIRENLQLRGTEWTVERRENGHAIKHRAPRRFDLSYVCTAWTNEIEDEHRLLWQVLQAMIRCPEIPRHLLHGELANLTAPVVTEVAQPDGLLRDPADVWSALDNRIRPSVNVVITLPLRDSDPVDRVMVRTRRLRFDEPNRTVELIQIAGRVATEEGKPLSNIVVRVKGTAFSTETSEDGWFAIAGMREGSFSLEADIEGQAVSRQITVPGTEYDLIVTGGSQLTTRTGESAQQKSQTNSGKRSRQES